MGKASARQAGLKLVVILKLKPLAQSLKGQVRQLRWGLYTFSASVRCGYFISRSS